MGWGWKGLGGGEGGEGGAGVLRGEVSGIPYPPPTPGSPVSEATEGAVRGPQPGDIPWFVGLEPTPTF